MRPSVLLVTAPFLSVVRPPLGVSLLKSALARRGIAAAVEPLHVTFAERIGVEVNERLAEEVPTHLLFGEWLFAAAWRGRRSSPAEAEYLASLRDALRDLPPLPRLIARAADFVDAAAARLAGRGAQVVAFSTSFQQTLASLAIAERLKRLRPRTIVCFGGANCEGPMGEALLAAYPWLDAVFSGEADHTLPDFVAAVEEGRGAVERRVHVAASAPAMDELPTPDFSDYFAAVDATSFRHRLEIGVTFESSRGCWWGAKRHCRFCGLNGSSMQFRAKSAERVLDEVEELERRWRIGRFAAADNILGVRHVEGVFGELARRGSHLRFFYEIKANLSRRQLETLARGGLTWVQPGIESLDDEVLERMEKGVSALQNLRLLRNCAELGISVLWNLLAGFPGETDAPYERMAQLLPKIEHLDPPNSCTPVRLDRFSPYFERAGELGFSELRPMPAYAVVYELPERLLRDLAYFYTGVPSAAVSDAALAAVRSAIARWRQRTRHDPAILAVARAEGLSLVSDTRRIASERWVVLDEVDEAVLAAFREPAEVSQALGRVAVSRPGCDVDGAFGRLTARDYLHVDRGRALSLVVDAGGRVLPPECAAEYPLGRLLPERATVEPPPPVVAVPTLEPIDGR